MNILKVFYIQRISNLVFFINFFPQDFTIKSFEKITFAACVLCDKSCQLLHIFLDCLCQLQNDINKVALVVDFLLENFYWLFVVLQYCSKVKFDF